MLRRCIQVTGANPIDCQIEADLAVVAVVQSEEYTRIWRATIQAIKTEGVNIPTYCNSNAQHAIRYFRLDLSPRLGVAFTHAYPHVHTAVTEAPRFSLNGWASPNVVIDFFEHVYLECYHRNHWLAWAERRYGADTGTVPAHTTLPPSTRSRQSHVLLQILNTGILEGLRAEVNELKRQLRREKDNAYPLRADEAKCAVC